MSDNGTPLGVQDEAIRQDSAHPGDARSAGVHAEVRLTFDGLDKERFDWLRGHVHADVVLQRIAECLMRQDSDASAQADAPTAAASRNDADAIFAGNAPAITFADVPITAVPAPASMKTRNADTVGDGVSADASADAASAPFGQSGEATTVPGTAMPTTRRAVVVMQSKVRDAEHRFRSAVVSLDAVPGTQIEGISPLYHVSNLDGPDAMSAVLQLTTTMTPKSFVATLRSLTRVYEGSIELTVVDMEGVHSDDPDCVVPWAEAGSRASVLAPWMDMDPDAQFGGKPVSFLLALAPDAMQVGLLSDNWIIGETQPEQLRQGETQSGGTLFGESPFGETQLGGTQ
ncbi:hypothetical protein [Bifidobacterium sp.]|jgi:dihydroneopterin aldolase/2-amino-4-hydroxy-6-hydroxymethyldihydropteridine diphosphokinase|nr:hypothetical protein [Bifidobacterium sp.]MCI1225515.1 hypothetical protein [Bifidobacterium sp.]